MTVAIYRLCVDGDMENVLVTCCQALANQHVSLAERLHRLLEALWREIARWKDVEKRAITAQVTVDPATLDSLDQMYEFAECMKTSAICAWHSVVNQSINQSGIFKVA